MTTRRVLDLTLLLLAVLVGCSFMVDPHEDNPRCVPSASGPVCPEGLKCLAGRCQRARSNEEFCGDSVDNDGDGRIDETDALGRDTCGDGVDNDCDGTIDEGSDGDMDGYQWCGITRSADGGPPPMQDIDCDDFSDETHPNAPEVCDGRDNDCDGTIDEAAPGSSLCMAGQVCAKRCVAATANCASDPSRCGADQQCVPETGTCVPRQCSVSSCAADEVCDDESRTCRKRDPLANGGACKTDEDCQSGVCIDGAALRLAKTEHVCAQACCTDAECADGERCFNAGTGARSCLPVGMLPPETPPHCTTDLGCGTGALCGLSREQALTAPTFTPLAEVVTSTCTGDRGLQKKTGERCASYMECASRLCIPGGLLVGFICGSMCGTSSDCGRFASSARVSASSAYCRYVEVTYEDLQPDHASICVVRRGETGVGGYGAECSSSKDCYDGGCVGAAGGQKGRCTPACCSDSQCVREDGGRNSCRPFAFGARYEMRCDI